MNKKVVFISLPMSGIPDDIVRASIEQAKGVYLSITNLDISQVVFVDTMNNPDPPEYVKDDQKGVWYLGHSLTHLAKCDEAFFWFGWRKARGCQVEHDVCVTYGIPMTVVDHYAEENA